MALPEYTRLAACICLAVSSVHYAEAACNIYLPGNGETVECNNTVPNPASTPVVSADGTAGISVTLSPDSQLDVTSGPAISLGDGSTVLSDGIIHGTTAGVLLREGSSILTNSGTITGTAGAAVQFNGSGNNQLINRGTLTGTGQNAVIFGSGNDSLLMTEGTINGSVSQGSGADKTEIRGGAITGALSQGNGIDDFVMSGGTLGSLQQGDNRDTFTMTGGTITGAFEDGDVARMSGGKIGRVDMKLDNNIFDMSGGQIVGNLVTGFGNDTILISGNSQTGGNISVSGGTDSVTMTGGTVGGEIRMSTGNDFFHWEGGTIQGAVLMGDDNDRIEFSNLSAASASGPPLIDGGKGNDTLVMNNSQYVHRTANVLQGIEHISLQNHSRLTLLDNSLPLGDAQNDGTGTGYNIDASSTLAVRDASAVAFNSHLSGTGILKTDTGGNAFSFTGNNAGDHFAGTVSVGNGTFDLSGLNTQALSEATLEAAAGSIITVGHGEQYTGGLTFDGGTVDFGVLSPGDVFAGNTIQTRNTLNLRGSGTVRVGVNNLVHDRPDINDSVPLLAQDDVNTVLKLAGSDDSVLGDAGSLLLADEHGTPVTDSVARDILQNGVSVARGTWDWRLTAGEAQDGLYVAYGLQTVALQGTDSNALTLKGRGATGSAADLSARVTGRGDLSFEGGTVSLSNRNNDYTGVTDVRSGTLLLSNDHVLGETSLLNQAAGTAVQINGYTQTVGEITTASGAMTDLQGGSLTLARGGTVSGRLQGGGTLIQRSGTLDIHGENASLNAQTRLLDGAEINLDNVSGLGTGDIDNAGALNLSAVSGTLANRLSNNGEVNLNDSQVALGGDNTAFSGMFTVDDASTLTVRQAAQLGSAAIADSGMLIVDTHNDWTLTNSVTGAGGLTKVGGGTLRLTQASAAYTGQTDILDGGVIFGTRSDPMTVTSSRMNVENGFLAGNGTVVGDVDNRSILLVGSPTSQGFPAAASFSTLATRTVATTDALTVGGNLSNSGLIQVGQTGNRAVAGNRLTVNGGYQGNGGQIAFNTVLGDDRSATDRMIITGDTSGTTRVSVTNAGGRGDLALNGIELITVGGESNGEFTQNGRIVAGAYDYRLARGTAENQKNWYLTNNASPLPGVPDDPEPGHPENSIQEGGRAEVMLRPEAGSYVNNLLVANGMFSTRLHDRLGEAQYTDALTGEQRVTSLWLRQAGTRSGWRSDSGGLKTTDNQYVAMLGGDLAWWSLDGRDRGHLGLMGGYGNNHSTTRSSVTGYRARGTVEGYSAGLYGTWYANDAEKTGLYLDGWAQYSWFKNTVSSEGMTDEKYDSDGVTASLESGYTWKTGTFTGSKGTLNTVYLQPQAQLTWMNVRADSHIESNGTDVGSGGDGNIQSRLGTRLFINSHSQLDNGKDRQFEPFIEANWLHNTRTWSASMNDMKVSQSGARNLGEVKTGVEGQLSRNLTVWGNIGQQVGDQGYYNTVAMLGGKYSW